MPALRDASLATAVARARAVADTWSSVAAVALADRHESSGLARAIRTTEMVLVNGLEIRGVGKAETAGQPARQGVADMRQTSHSRGMTVVQSAFVRRSPPPRSHRAPGTRAMGEMGRRVRKVGSGTCHDQDF